MSSFLLDTCMDEFGANLIYTSNDIHPHFALDRAVKDANGSKRATFGWSGETWAARLWYQESGLASRDHPDYRLETVREHRIMVKPVDDPAGKRRAQFHVAPRWPDMETTEGNAISTPNLLGVNVKAQGAKLDFDAYPELLRRGADALDINPAYFASEHPYSNIYEAETYVRANRKKTGTVFGDGSPMQRIHELAGRSGKYRKLIEDDRGEEGIMHLTAFTPETASALISGHGLGKRPKHYLPKHPPADPEDPLHHPKVCMLFKQALNTGSVPWSDRGDLRRELDETLLNLLSWAGLPTRPDGETFIEDGYFEPSDSIRPTLSIVEDPTPEIKREQGAAVVKALAGLGTGNPDLTQSDTEALKVMADGGQAQSVESLAGAIGRSRRTVYRIVDRLSSLLDLADGIVAFGSDYLAAKARHGVRSARDAFDRDGGASAEESPWSAFLAEYGPDVSHRFPNAEADNIELDFGEMPLDVDMQEVLKEGLRAWLRSGRGKQEYRAGRAYWTQDGRRDSTPELGGMNIDTIRASDSDLKSLR